MRSLQNMSGSAARQLSLPPLPLDGRSENAGAGAHIQHLDTLSEDAGAGAGSALAENAAGSTPMTPPPLPPPAASPAASPRSAPPSPKLATSDARDAVEVTLQRMLARSKLPAATAPAHPAAPAASKKQCKTPTKKEPAGKIIKNKMDGVASTPTKHDRKPPRISRETSRNQVMCRSGFSGPGSTHKITFKEAGGAKQAYALAEKWLEKEKKEYEKAHK